MSLAAHRRHLALARDRAPHLDTLLTAQHRTTRTRQLQCAVRVVCDLRKAQRHQLPKDAAPGLLVQIRADAEHAELVVAPARDTLAGLAA